jgi:hypothetical protein
LHLSSKQRFTVAQRALLRALRPEIDQGNITADLNNDRLQINLASSMLFESGEDQLKPAGVDALKRIGAVLSECFWGSTSACRELRDNHSPKLSDELRLVREDSFYPRHVLDHFWIIRMVGIRL